MSKQQSKQTFNSGNTQLSDTRNQGAANNTQLQGILSGYQGNANALFPGISAGYGDIGQTGGFDPGVLGQINTAYGDLSTGGISPNQISALSNQAAQTGRSAYQTAGADLQRRIANTGGFGFSGAAEANMARGASSAAANSTNNMLANLVGLQSQNKAIGAGGLATTQNAITGNRLAGLGGQQGLYNTNVGASEQTMQQVLQNFQTTGQLSNQDLQILAGVAAEPGWGMNTINGIAQIGQAAAGIMKAWPG